MGTCAMSEQQKEQEPTQQTDAKPDSKPLNFTSAAAALAQAVTSASTDKPMEKALVAPVAEKAAVPAKPGSPRPAWNGYAMQAAAVAVALGLGWFAGSRVVGPSPQGAPQWAEAASADMRQNHDDVVRLTGDVRALKGIVDSLKDGVDRARGESTAQQDRVSEGLARIERSHDTAAAKLDQALDSMDRTQRAGTDAAARLAETTARLETVERQAATIASTTAAVKPTPVAAVEAPLQTGSVPDPKLAKQLPLEGWVLHDVQGGIALVESRNGRLHEVAAGQTLPTLGRVEAIERKGRSWVVVTSKGIIGAGRWQ
jgi:hypothetical protein